MLHGSIYTYKYEGSLDKKTAVKWSYSDHQWSPKLSLKCYKNMSDQPNSSFWKYIEKSDKATDHVSYTQLFAAAGLGKIQNIHRASTAAKLLCCTEEHLKQHTKKYTVGNVIMGLKVRDGITIPEEAMNTARGNDMLDEEPLVESDVRCYVPTLEKLISERERPKRTQLPMSHPHIDDFEIRTASTTITAGTKLENIRRLQSRTANSSDERLERLEAISNELVHATEKINNALRKFSEMFGQHVETIDVMQEAIKTVQHNIEVLDADMDKLFN